MKEGDHAVLPYAVEVLGDTLVRVHVYDSNWPGRDRYVDIDTERGSWAFSFASDDPKNDPSPWSGRSGSIDLASLASRQAGNCPFCESESVARNSVLVIKSTKSDWSVSTEEGTYSPATGKKTRTRHEQSDYPEHNATPTALIAPATVPPFHRSTRKEAQGRGQKGVP